MAPERSRAVVRKGVPGTKKTDTLRWSIPLAGALCFGAGFLCARVGGSAPLAAPPDGESGARAASDSSEPASDPSESKRRKIERPFLVRAADSCGREDPERERAYRVQQSREMIGLLRARLGTAERFQVGGAETVLASMSPYLHAWADAVTRTAPDMAEELASELQGVMCDKKASDTQLLLATQVVKRVPELANAGSFDCIVARGVEDSVLWEALAAWRETSLPLTPEMEKLSQSTHDERTRQGLVRPDEAYESESPDELARGMAAAPNADPAAASGAISEQAPLSAQDVMLALRHAQRTGNTDSAKALSAALERLQSSPARGAAGFDTAAP